jgi:hypothetical protein
MCGSSILSFDCVSLLTFIWICGRISFDGCGVTNGTLGVLFAAGLDHQADLAVKIIQEMLRQQQPATTTTTMTTDNSNDSSSTQPSSKPPGIHVVAVGLSRGGMACMKLARKLAQQFTQTEVTASMLLFDPVPGNAVTTGFPWTACWSQDLSGCHNLLRVLALCPYEALPDIAMHAPTLCRYNHETTLVQEDVCTGCHQGALFMPTLVPRSAYDEASNLSMRRILDYLEYEGVTCDFPNSIYVPSPQTCIKLCEEILQRPESHTKALQRKTHDQTGQRRLILRHPSSSDCQWLNRHHEQLEKAVQQQTKGGGISSSTVTLEAVFGDSSGVRDKTTATAKAYLLDFDDGYVVCPGSSSS